jgi:glycosyltransferase involved in cell wall biosynthesis
MKIWLFQVGEPLHIDSSNLRPMRAMNLSNKLIASGHQVVIWSSAFSHQEKKHRSLIYTKIKVNANLEIRLIPSCGYSKHISFRRAFDHIQLSFNLKKVLLIEDDFPDVAFIGYPPIEFAAVASRWLKKHSIPSILDVKDLWPQIFLEAIPNFLNLFGKMIFFPYSYYAKRTINDADAISAMAPSFLNSVLQFSNRKSSSLDKVFRLTAPFQVISKADLIIAENWWKTFNIDNSQVNLFFVGTFSRNMDFQPIKEAAMQAKSNGKKWRFVLCGNGPRYVEIKNIMKDLDNIIFPGWVDIVKITALGKMSKATIAPYINVENFINNIPNKIIDSLALGLPILSPLKGEVSNLITKHGVGLFYSEYMSLYQCIEKIINPDLHRTLSSNVRKVYAKDFEFNMVYDDFILHLESLVKNDVESIKK